MEIDRGGCDGELWQFEHDAHLGNEIHAFAPAHVLCFELHSVLLRGGPCELFVGEKPLRLTGE